MGTRICALMDCGVEFTPKQPNQRYHSLECSYIAKCTCAEKHNAREKIVKARYKARGVTNDDVHPNQRGINMTQYVGTFRIEGGKVVTK